MASLEDKVRGKKKHNYASSSEDEDDQITSHAQLVQPLSDGLPQTGPKGVLTDYSRYKEDQYKLKLQEEKEKKKLVEKMAFTVKPRSEETDGASDSNARDLMEALEQLENDEKDPFLQQYRAQRMHQMKEQAKAGNRRRMFGNLIELRGDKYATTIDTAPRGVYVVIHIYDEFILICLKLNRCLTELAKMYPTVKFCRIQSYQLGLSKEFLDKGLPALLVYKDGEMIGNLLRVSDGLGQNFTTSDVEEFLHSNNCLPSADEARVLGKYNLSPRPSIIKTPLSDTDED